MSSPETRQYLITGEISPADWELALRILGRLSIDAKPIDTEDLKINPGLKAMDDIEEGIIPYRLDEITSRKQYISNEHLGEFWPEYVKYARENGLTPAAKGPQLIWGLNMLAHPRRKGIGYRMSEPQSAQYAEELGLKVVRPRSLAGFSDEYAPGAYGLWNHEKYGDSVIEVGSFIDCIPRLAALPARERPYDIDSPVLRFFAALADKLAAQTSASEESPTA